MVQYPIKIGLDFTISWVHVDLMQYKIVQPVSELRQFIQYYWELKGNEKSGQWERVFPDGCAGVFVNLGDTCLTDNGLSSLEFGKTYVVGAMCNYKDSFITSDTHLIGACFRPGAFTYFYDQDSREFLTNDTVELDDGSSFNPDKMIDKTFEYLNGFLWNRKRAKYNPMESIIHSITLSNEQLTVQELASNNYISVRQLERQFKKHIGLSPKEYLNIVRFQNAIKLIRKSDKRRSLLDIAFECGYYDHSHFTSEIKTITGILPSQL